MNLLDKAISFVSPTAGVNRAKARAQLKLFGYDAARATNERKQAPHSIAPNTFSTQRDRIQLMRESIDLECNFAPAKTLNRKYAMYVAPQSYNAQTGDAGLDKAIESYLNDIWFPNCDITGRFNFWSMLEFGVMGQNTGGDYGWAMIRPGQEDGMVDADISKLDLKLQAVEADRIGGTYENIVKDNYVGGITIGKYGEPTAYKVYRRAMGVDQYVDPVDVPAHSFIHYLDPMRIDQYRGIPRLDAACTHARDLYEMIGFIKAKTKLAGSLTIITASNGATIGDGGMDAYSMTDNNRAQLQTDIQVGQINHLSGTSDIKFPDSQAPGPETQYLMGLLLEMLCMSYNLPYSFGINASKLGGVSARLESEQAKAEFERGQKILARHAHRMVSAALLDATAKGIFDVKYSGILTKGKFSYRAHPQPDIGKEASAAVSLNQNGLLDPISYWSDQGQDPETIASNMGKWYEIKQKEAEKRGTTTQEIFGAGPSMPVSKTESDGGGGDSATGISTEGDNKIDTEGELQQVAAAEAAKNAGLNGAQVAALIQVIQSVSDNVITSNAAIEIIGAAFPSIPRDQVIKIMKGAIASAPPI